jgi:hypothetical protein
MMLREWGRKMMIYTLIISLGIYLAGIVRYWYFASDVETAVRAPGMEVAARHSMVPFYIIFIIQAVFLFVISSRVVREGFSGRQAVPAGQNGSFEGEK